MSSSVWLGVILTSLILYLPRVEANPTGGQVVEGSADIVSTSSTRLDILQYSDRAIIDWTGFSISQNERTHFQQPSSQAIALNRVTGGNPSLIFGQLSATGRLVLVNPNGILFGPGSQVDVAGLVATTSDIHNSDFMNERLDFSLPSPTNAGVVNQGEITVQEGGLVAFVAPWVENSGMIQARLGRVSLVSGNTYTLDLYGDQLVQLAVDDAVVGDLVDVNGQTPQALVRNSGKIVAEGGIVHLSVSSAQTALDNVLNMDGIIEAQSVEERNGVIVLHGGDFGIVKVAGVLDASGRDSGETGGEVLILGERVGLFASLSEESTKIDVSGDSGGGTVLVGGNFQGQGPEANAKATVVASDVDIYADAKTEGDGGTVIVWADETTKFYGSISAQGGSQSGNGGFVETSGKEYLEVIGGQVDASAANGAAGEWLLDPRDVDIRNLASSGGIFDGLPAPDTFTPTADNAIADRNTIQTSLNNGTDVTITTGGTGTQNGNITVTDSITKSAGSSATLTLNAAGGITVNNPISSGSNQLNLSLIANGGNISQSVAGILSIDGTTNLSASGADITLTQANDFGTVSITNADNVILTDSNGIDLGAATVSAAFNVTTTTGNITSSGALAVTGNSTFTANAVGASINVDNAGNNFGGSVTFAGAGGLANVSVADTTTLDLQALTLTGNLSVTANGITDSGGLDVAGTTTLNAGVGNDIILNRLDNDFNSVVVTNGRDVTLRDSNGIDLGASTITQNLDVTTTTGNITNSGNLNVTGTAAFTASAAGASISVDQAGNTFNNTVTFAGGGGLSNVSVADTTALDLQAMTLTGDLTVTAAGVTDSGNLIIGGTTTVAAGAGNDITLNTASNNFSTVSITSGNNVTVVDTNALNLGTSTVSGNLTLNSGSTLDLAASTVSGALNVTANGAVTDSGALVVTGTTTVAAGAGNDITLDTASNNFSTLSVTSGNNVTVQDTNGIDLGTSTVSGTLNVTASGAVTDSGTLVVTGTTTVTAGASNDVTLNEAANDFSTIGITSGKDVTLVDTNAIDLGTSTISGDLNVTAGGAVTDSGTLIVAGTTTITAGAGNDVTLNQAANDFNTVGITSARDVILVDTNGIDLAASTISGDLTVTANGTISESGTLSVSGTKSLVDTSSSSSTVSIDQRDRAVNSAQVALGPRVSGDLSRNSGNLSDTVLATASSLRTIQLDGFSESEEEEEDDEEDKVEEGQEEQIETNRYFELNTI